MRVSVAHVASQIFWLIFVGYPAGPNTW